MASYATDALTIEVRSTQLIRLCNYYGMHERGRANPEQRYPGETFLFDLPPELACTLTVAGDFNRRHRS